ncbi:hypothetical protein E4U53_005116 [Claviceps sorghi]|nr:hypothetical protein E4U53_005116 [Claviceps sorghi]
MLVKNLIVSFFGLSVAVEAAQTSFRSPIARTLELRQQRGEQRGKNAGVQSGGRLGGDRGGGQGDNQGDNQGTNNGDDGGLALNPDLVQTASQDDGNNPGADGQAASATSNNNFINFCSGKTLTNGKQIKQGVFVNPQNGANLPANQDFKIQVQMINFKAGTFTNATSNYYSAPQDLDAQGNIIGHTHVTIQDTGKGLNPKRPLDPTQFAFFKGINDAGNNKGLLAADVTGGLPAGNYRLCSMSAAANHQPVLMPVAQRGAQDDCVRFTVGGGPGGGNAGDNGNANGSFNGKGQGGQGRQGSQQGGQTIVDDENGGTGNAQLPETQGSKQGQAQNGNQSTGQADAQDGRQTGTQEASQTQTQPTGRQGSKQTAKPSGRAGTGNSNTAAAENRESIMHNTLRDSTSANTGNQERKAKAADKAAESRQ